MVCYLLRNTAQWETSRLSLIKLQKNVFFSCCCCFTAHNAFKMRCSSVSMTSVTTPYKNSCINRLLRPFVPHSWASTLLFYDLSSANKYLSPSVTGCLLMFTKQKLWEGTMTGGACQLENFIFPGSLQTVLIFLFRLIHVAQQQHQHSRVALIECSIH